ncbi:MAG TPA: NnrS family protein, partial [Polyangiaceae bacterium]|nr:NnrS family protein [Polyangiaceae bacterium]
MQLLTLEPRVVPTSHSAFFASGFRPFFLGASLFAAFGVPFWVATLLGNAPWRPPANPLDWHAHEMVFGFTGAVFAGFLLTAIRRWTGQGTVDGWRLGALFGMWLLARVLPFVPGAERGAAVVDVAFFVGLLLACAAPIVRSRNRRNYGFVGLLGGLTLAVAISHANRLGLLHGEFWAVRSFGIDLVSIGMVVMTGRIVPSFTRNATGATDIAETPRYDRAAASLLVLVTLLDAVSAARAFSAVPAALAGVLVLARAR